MMIVFNSSYSSVDDDYSVNETLVERCSRGEDILRVWKPPAHVSFGPRDTRHPDYGRAKAIAKEYGLPVKKRHSGGHAVAYTGTTVAFGLYQAVEDRNDITARYDDILPKIQAALEQCGVETVEGEPEQSFCPGSYSLSCEGKIVGTAQRVHRETAVTSGIVVCKEETAIADILDEIYPLLGIPFSRESVGSVAAAGGLGSPEVVMQAIEECIVDSDSADYRSIHSLTT